MARESNSVETYMPLVIEKYHGDTLDLTTIQHGAYLLLLMAYWRRGGALPADDTKLAAISKLSPADWKKHRPTLAEYFEQRDGKWFQKRAEFELARARKKSAAAAASARTRWVKHADADANASPDAMQGDMRNECGSDAPPSSIPVDAYASPGVSAKPERRSRRKSPGIPMPSEWEPTGEQRGKAAEIGVDCAFQAEKFRAWARAKDARYARWDWAFDNWLLNAKGYENGRKSGADRGREAHQIFLEAAFASARREGSG